MTKPSLKGKKKILLFMAKPTKNNEYDWLPHASLIVATLLEKAGFEVVIIQEFLTKNIEAEIKLHIHEVLFCGTTATTGWQITAGIKFAKIVKRFNSEIPMVWGGIHPTIMPTETLKSPYVDYICLGKVKDNITTFARNLNLGKSCTNIPDIISSEDTNQVSVKIEKDYYELSYFPAIPWEKYDFSGLITENKVLNYLATLGCPASCSFCPWGGKHNWIKAPTERVISDITYLSTRYNLNYIWFCDATLTTNKKFVLDIAEGIKQKTTLLGWRACSRIPEIARFAHEDIKLLYNSGLDQLFFGIESIHKASQKIYKKDLSQDMIESVVAKFAPFDIKLNFSYIFGMPRAPLVHLDEDKAFMDRLKEINPNVFFQIAFYVPFPGSDTFKMAIEDGFIPPSSFEEYGEYYEGIEYLPQHDALLPWYTPHFREKYIEKYFSLFGPDELIFKEWKREEGHAV